MIETSDEKHNRKKTDAYVCVFVRVFLFVVNLIDL